LAIEVKYPVLPPRVPTKATVTEIIPPEEWLKTQINNLKAVGESTYRIKIAHPKADPIVRGIETEDKYQEALKISFTERRRAKALQATNIDEWYAFAQGIGAPRLVEGVVARIVKVDRFIKGWQPRLVEHTRKIRALPEVTDKEREDRVIQNLRGRKALKGVWRGST